MSTHPNQNMFHIKLHKSQDSVLFCSILFRSDLSLTTTKTREWSVTKSRPGRKWWRWRRGKWRWPKGKRRERWRVLGYVGKISKRPKGNNKSEQWNETESTFQEPLGQRAEPLLPPCKLLGEETRRLSPWFRRNTPELTLESPVSFRYGSWPDQSFRWDLRWIRIFGGIFSGLRSVVWCVRIGQWYPTCVNRWRDIWSLERLTNVILEKLKNGDQSRVRSRWELWHVDVCDFMGTQNVGPYILWSDEIDLVFMI